MQTENRFFDDFAKMLNGVAGTFAGKTSPVPTFSAMVYADIRLIPRTSIAIPAEHEERGLFLVEGEIEIDGAPHPPGQLLVLRPKTEVVVTAPSGARLMLLGGEPMDGPRHIWWNFVSSSEERIEAAKADWRAGRFPPADANGVRYLRIPMKLDPALAV